MRHPEVERQTVGRLMISMLLAAVNDCVGDGKENDWTVAVMKARELGSHILIHVIGLISTKLVRGISKSMRQRRENKQRTELLLHAVPAEHDCLGTPNNPTMPQKRATFSLALTPMASLVALDSSHQRPQSN